MRKNDAIMTKEELQEEAYRLYQLDWMKSHGYSVRDLAMAVINSHNDRSDPEDADAAKPDASAYDTWEYEDGFNGEIWACKEEFLESEYLDSDYMAELLTDKDFTTYLSMLKTS